MCWESHCRSTSTTAATAALSTTDVIAGDDAHTGPYATLAERQGTIVHELGHAINLMHELHHR
jgi:hypothetical protein